MILLKGHDQFDRLLTAIEKSMSVYTTCKQLNGWNISFHYWIDKIYGINYRSTDRFVLIGRLFQIFEERYIVSKIGTTLYLDYRQ